MSIIVLEVIMGTSRSANDRRNSVILKLVTCPSFKTSDMTNSVYILVLLHSL